MDNGSTGIMPVMPIGNGTDSFGGGFWIFALLILMAMMNGGFGWGNNGLANAIGYENLATSNEVQRGFDNQNLQSQTRDILAAVNSGTAQSVAATNQTFHDSLMANQNLYNEIARDIGNVQVGQANLLANQNACCCDTKMLIQTTSADTNSRIAESKYESALNTASINANTTAQTQKILDALAQNKIESLQAQVNALELQAATSNVLRYPNSWTYNAGMSPFCGCNCGC